MYKAGCTPDEKHSVTSHHATSLHCFELLLGAANRWRMEPQERKYVTQFWNTLGVNKMMTEYLFWGALSL